MRTLGERSSFRRDRTPRPCREGHAAVIRHLNHLDRQLFLLAGEPKRVLPCAVTNGRRLNDPGWALEALLRSDEYDW